MDIIQIVSVVGFTGALGGLANSFVTGELVLPKLDPEKWRPGWVGNVFVGALASLVVWAMYGPMSSYDLAIPDSSKQLTLTLSQLIVSVPIGLGGGNILTQLAQRQSDQLTKQNLLNAITTSQAPKSSTPPNP